MTPPVSNGPSLRGSPATSPISLRETREQELRDRINKLTSQLLDAQRDLAFLRMHKDR